MRLAVFITAGLMGWAAQAGTNGVWRMVQSDCTKKTPPASPVSLTIFNTTSDSDGERKIVQFAPASNPSDVFYSAVFSVVSSASGPRPYDLSIDLTKWGGLFHEVQGHLHLIYSADTKVTSVTGFVQLSSQLGTWTLSNTAFTDSDPRAAESVIERLKQTDATAPTPNNGPMMISILPTTSDTDGQRRIVQISAASDPGLPYYSKTFNLISSDPDKMVLQRRTPILGRVTDELTITHSVDGSQKISATITIGDRKWTWSDLPMESSKAANYKLEHR